MIASIICSGQLVVTGHWGGWEDDQLVLRGEQGQEERIPRDDIVRISYHPNPTAMPGPPMPKIQNMPQ